MSSLRSPGGSIGTLIGRRAMQTSPRTPVAVGAAAAAMAALRSPHQGAVSPRETSAAAGSSPSSRWWPASPLFTQVRGIAQTPRCRNRRLSISHNNSRPELQRTVHLAPTPADPLDFIAMSLRSTVRTTGPIPLSKLTPLIADEMLEMIGQSGMSLVKFIESHSAYLACVHLPGRVIIAFSSNLYKMFPSNERRNLGMWVMALLSAAHHLPGQPQVVALGLSSPHPTLQELSNALRYWTVITPAELESFLRMLPDLFVIIAHSRRVRLLLLNAVAPDGHVRRTSVGGLLPLVKAAKPQEASKFVVWLRSVTPSQFHVPISHILNRARELNLMAVTFGTDNPTLDQVKRQFQQLPAGFADIRAFGDSPHTVFVRVINPEPLLLDSGVSTYGGGSTPPELDAVCHNPTQLAHELSDAILHYAEQSPLTRARVVKGVELSHLRDFVPAALMQKLGTFYGFSEKDDPRVCILLLDRLRHLWEVDLSAGTARPWALLSATELPSSLTLQTSPSPRVLLHCQRLLTECGAQPREELYNVLPSDLKTTFLELYGDQTTLQRRPTGAAATQVDGATMLAAVDLFLRTHSLFFFLQDGCVHTSRAIAKRESGATGVGGRGSGSATVAPPPPKSAAEVDRERAKMVYDAIPPGAVVMVDTLSRHLMGSRIGRQTWRGQGPPPRGFRREFIGRYPQLFRVHHMFGLDKLTVSRADTPIAETNFVSPRIDTIYRLIKMMALFSLNSISDASLTRRLPPDGRHLLRSLGTATDVASQLPMWFAVHRDEINFGGSLIRYIGPLADTKRSANALRPHPRGVLTRKVPNNPFADIPPDNFADGHIDGWNDDWNEEEDVFGESSKWVDDDD